MLFGARQSTSFVKNATMFLKKVSRDLVDLELELCINFDLALTYMAIQLSCPF